MKCRLILLICTLALAACGIKGPLELPPRPGAVPPAPAQAPADLNKAPSPKPQ